MAVSFPTNPEALKHYPSLAKYFKKEVAYERSERQIFRLLDKRRKYDGLLNFLDEMASTEVYRDFVFQKINTSNLQEFLTGLYEVYSLRFLLNNGYVVDTFDDSKADQAVPEFRAVRDDVVLLVELYTPFELCGYELFYDELRIGLRYLDVPFNFEVEVELINDAQFDSSSKYYHVYDFKELFSNYGDRQKEIEAIKDKVRDALNQDGKAFKHSLKENLLFKIQVQRKAKGQERKVSVTGGSHSYSSGLYFDLAPCNARQYYSKVYDKLNKGQLCVQGESDAIKVFYICTNEFIVRDGYELVKNEGEGYYSRQFYEKQRECFEQYVDPSKVDLIFPVIAGVDDGFYVGSSLFNPGDLDTSELWTNPPAPDLPEMDSNALDVFLNWYENQFRE